ncbi:MULTISPECIES: DoxX family membrane protein [Arthrobacter]|uniref:DoxX family membrane protein n=2 Tax=Arthrobacter TaxID=1663 RepID=A0ABU9KNE9_9MICC|nr:DoxX family membrane protein [Arthrobacter sp. YJM1]MDP5227280.1 DoxX family membrane protein [Arthrobacter sp. YJM1]
MSVVRFLARPLIASSFISEGIAKAKAAQDPERRPSALVRRAADALPVELGDAALNRITAGVQVGAGGLYALGRFPRFAALLLAGSAACSTLIDYRAADATSKEGRAARRRGLLKNLALVGATLLATVDTAGKPSLAWRASNRPSATPNPPKGH